jgi:thymidylate synthase ThyX
VRYHVESFTLEETAILNRFFTNVDLPVFGLVNLPEVVKGALFARYSRSSKSIRRLFLDEFTDPETGVAAIAAAADEPIVDMSKAEQLYQRIFVEYGDDSVAQLGGTHLACEQASNILTKVLEWGRLAAYLEQSTRYIFYDTTVDGRYRYAVPPELESGTLSTEYLAHLDWMFDTYSKLVRDMKTVYERRFPQDASDPPGVYNATIRAKACDSARGLLPAATLSNVGVYATGQAYEMALVRMAAHPLAEVREYGDMMLGELRKVIPSFLSRVDKPDRGRRWSAYLADVAERLDAHGSLLGTEQEEGPSVRLTDYDPEAELKLTAAALYAHSEVSDGALLDIAADMTAERRARVIADLLGDRENRRHKPGRPMERISYRFDVVCDFGAFRDLQRHRLMTIEWQRLTTRLGFDTPPDIVDAGHTDAWAEAMDRSRAMYERVRDAHGADVAQYVVPFAANIRFVMEMNARQAYHLIELRSQAAGHTAYRRVAHEMHRLIAEEAGHTAIAGGMKFIDHSDVDLERLEAERAAERRKVKRATG